jgi:hypothetical protein
LAFRGPKLGAVFAAVTTATVASVLIPDMIIYASIGCYAGMTNVKAPPLLTICILTSIAGVCFEYFGVLAGKGGRLGVCAFLGSTTAISLVYGLNPSAVSPDHFYDANIVSYGDIDGYMVFDVFASNLLGVSFTYLCRKVRPFLSPVVAGSATSMMLIMMLESCFSVVFPPHYRFEATGSFLQGAFVGMSSFEILRDLPSVFATGVLSGLVTLLLFPVFPLGEGGKRGFMACIGVHIFIGLRTLHSFYQTYTTQRQRQKESQQQPPPDIELSSI